MVGGVGGELWERLQGPGSWPERFATCDEVLTRIVEPDRTIAPPLGLAWAALVRSGGTTSTSVLAATAGWSRQHFTRRFDDEFGLGPKLASRVVRFERARRMIETRPAVVSMASVAAACGYYDQAHLSRDFTELAGCTPKTWMAEEDLPSFQDEATTGV